MARVVSIKSLTIPNGGTTSNVLDAALDYYGLMQSILVQAPAVLDAGAYTIEVSQDNAAFATLCGADGTTALALPAATKAKIFQAELTSAKFIRFKQVGAAAADRVFLLTGQEFLSA